MTHGYGLNRVRTSQEAEMDELKKFVKDTFEQFLEEPTKEPAQTFANPFTKGDNYLTK